MNETYRKFLDEYEQIQGLDSRIDYVMNTLADMGLEKRFVEFQEILDHAEPEKFEDSTANLTIAVVGHWYGKKLNLNPYIDRAMESYAKVKGLDYAKKLFDKHRKPWEPMFGFERGLFGITE